MTAFEVRLEVFNGPLDLLLSLVRRESLEITTVALASVTNQFLDHLRRLEEIDPGALADFCETAASLMLIKSRALLPRERKRALEDEEPDSDELAARLRAYEHYRQVAGQLGQREETGLRAYVRVAPPAPDLPPVVEAGAGDPELLAEALRAALRTLPPADSSGPVVAPHRVRISERLSSIRRRLLAERRIRFVDALTDGPRTREFIVVSFLAVLELLRRAAVRVDQDALFGDIFIEILSEDALTTTEDGAAGTFLDEE